MQIYVEFSLVILILIASFGVYRYLSVQLKQSKVFSSEFGGIKAYSLLNQRAPELVVNSNMHKIDLSKWIEDRGLLLIFIDLDCPHCIPSLELFLSSNTYSLEFIVLIRGEEGSRYSNLYTENDKLQILHVNGEFFEAYQINEFPYYIFVNKEQFIVYASSVPDGLLNNLDFYKSISNY
ncbi:hypothetical protein SAMN04488542_11596 [Fontibacillus panacisegetis]|uniref:Thioredoxin domain-containing protein n=1 Tax=Fontibacillus panacisegetis TaxID=670482 RepID=A0A1G7NDP3_9BACL|nr:hypothetical protein [Fontibacillus panacisegetis]SDF71420.1 hypothetical protein SAMN04488542_11596 [Fontibacillus panacisegetis]